MDVQNAIQAVYAASIVLFEVEELSKGVRLPDMDATLARATALRRSYMAVASLAPGVRPRTETLSRLAKTAIEAVIQRSESAEGRKALARRALLVLPWRNAKQRANEPHSS